MFMRDNNHNEVLDIKMSDPVYVDDLATISAPCTLLIKDERYSWRGVPVELEEKSDSNYMAPC